jgi:hypothetical protein
LWEKVKDFLFSPQQHKKVSHYKRVKEGRMRTGEEGVRMGEKEQNTPSP